MKPLSRAEINVQNAQHSTGPRTPEGKAASSKNAIKHGLTASTPFVLPEEQDDFERLTKSLWHESEPTGPIEDELFQQMLHAAWKMRRIRILEAKLESQAGGEALLDANLDSDLTRLARHYARAERTFHRSLNQLKQMQTERNSRRHSREPWIETISPLAASAKVIKQSQLKWEKSPPRRPGTVSEVLADLFLAEKLDGVTEKSKAEVFAR